VEKEITISCHEKIYSLGAGIPVKIKYHNGSSREWIFTDPARTPEVKLIVNYKDDTDQVSFGRYHIMQDDRFRRRVREDAITITLQASAGYEFDYDPGKRWPDIFRPGFNIIYLKDLYIDSETIFSNEIRIDISYDNQTILNLLSILEDEKSSLEARYFAINWIQKLKSDFKFNLRVNNEEKAKENQIYIAHLREWWAIDKTDKIILDMIENLNH
jgi:hypothetical protein